MKVKLVSNDMWSPSLEFTLEAFPAVIGRNGESDIGVNDPRVSPMHCELSILDDQLNLRDLRSTTGTLLNGQRVDRVVVQSGDTMTIGIRSFCISILPESPDKIRTRRNSPSASPATP